MSFFGFNPSEKLINNIHFGIQKKNASEPLYPTRDETALLINDEIINAILIEVIHRFPVSDKRETAEKLAGFIQSTVAVLLKQLLSKSPNEVVKQSIEFSESSLFKDSAQNTRVGFALDSKFTQDLKDQFAEILLGNDVNRTALSELYKQFADAAIRHFMTDFNKTLDLGMIKRKAADLATSAVTKAVHIAVDRLIPHLTKEELHALAEYHDTLFYV